MYWKRIIKCKCIQKEQVLPLQPLQTKQNEQVLPLQPLQTKQNEQVLPLQTKQNEQVLPSQHLQSEENTKCKQCNNTNCKCFNLCSQCDMPKPCIFHNK